MVDDLATNNAGFHQVLFVSHVSEDRAAALEIVQELERRGIRCWIAPRNVRPGKPFDDEIEEAIESCRAVLLIFSDRCNDSEYIRREVTVAGESQKAILPFRIENASPRKGLRIRLSDLHWIDGFVDRQHAIDEIFQTVAVSPKFSEKHIQRAPEDVPSAITRVAPETPSVDRKDKLIHRVETISPAPLEPDKKPFEASGSFRPQMEWKTNDQTNAAYAAAAPIGPVPKVACTLLLAQGVAQLVLLGFLLNTGTVRNDAMAHIMLAVMFVLPGGMVASACGVLAGRVWARTVGLITCCFASVLYLIVVVPTAISWKPRPGSTTITSDGLIFLSFCTGLVIAIFAIPALYRWHPKAIQP